MLPREKAVFSRLSAEIPELWVCGKRKREWNDGKNALNLRDPEVYVQAAALACTAPVTSRKFGFFHAEYAW